MELKEAIEATKIVRDSLKDFPNSYEILDTLLKGAEELQKENEKYRSGELLTANQVKSFEETTKKYYIHKDKIKEKIEELDKNELLGKYNYEQVKIAIDILNELLIDKEPKKYSTYEIQRNIMPELLKGE